MGTRTLTVAVVALLTSAAAPLYAQTAALTITGGTGPPGGTVTVALALRGDDDGAAVTVDVDLRFPTDRVEFNPPVSTNCRVDGRLAATHQIAGSLVEPGVLGLALFGRDLRILPVGNGALLSCDFHILPGAPQGPAPLTFAFAGLGGARGAELPVTGVDGAITVATAMPTPTPTPPPCAGDCNGNRLVTIEELIRGVQIVLGNQPVSNCPSLDRGGTGTVSVPDMIKAVNNTLDGCAS